MTAPRSSVVVRLADLSAPSARTVVAAALQLFGPADPVDVVLVLPGVDAVTEAHGEPVVDLVHGLGLSGLPEVLLQGEGEAAALTPAVTVEATGDPVADARAVVLLGAAAQQLWDADTDTDTARGAVPDAVPEPSPVPLAALQQLEHEVERAVAARDRARALERVARRDVRASAAVRAGERRPRVVLLFQHRSYWGAVATLHAALAARPEVDLTVVALDSTADGRRESTAAFLAEQGVRAHGPEHLHALLDEDAVDVVVLDNPYDEVRPAGLRVPDLVARGVRVVGVPYGGGAIGGALMERLLWDLPLQRSGWRSYVATTTQQQLQGAHCAAGAEGVRVLGAPKYDRVVQAARGELDVPGAARWRALAGGRPLVLWNPHFRVGDGGWSTFDQYLEPLLARSAADDRAALLVRPHFRLFHDLRLLGLGHLEQRLRAAAAEGVVLLDEEPDHLPALAACDAMLSDLSSLASELLPTGTPVLYLHRADGPGPNEEGAHFAAFDRADDWSGIARFLDEVVLAGRDPRRVERLAVAARVLPLSDGRAGERVADDLVRGLLDELGLVLAEASR